MGGWWDRRKTVQTPGALQHAGVPRGELQPGRVRRHGEDSFLLTISNIPYNKGRVQKKKHVFYPHFVDKGGGHLGRPGQIN